MRRTCLITHNDTRAEIRGAVVEEMRKNLNKKGGVWAADAVYTNAPTQPLFAQAHGLRIARGKRNTHGVRTNG